MLGEQSAVRLGWDPESTPEDVSVQMEDKGCYLLEGRKGRGREF